MSLHDLSWGDNLMCGSPIPIFFMAHSFYCRSRIILFEVMDNFILSELR